MKLALLLLISAMTLVVFFVGIHIGDRELYTSALSTGTLLSVLCVLFVESGSRKGGK